MYKKSKIEWTESTWNPITGCTKHSDGCKNCYAAVMARRLQAMGIKKYKNGFELSIHKEVFEEPIKNKKPTVYFVNSMSDLFHEDLELSIIKELFEVMNKAHWHTFQILTKRASNLENCAKDLCWTENIWMGVTVESDKYRHRIDNLRNVPALIRFISFEPLIADVSVVNLSGIDWAIVGGESGIGARNIDEEWVLNIKEQCDKQNTLFYFKQWGGINKKKNGRLLLGRHWDAMPQLFKVRG